MRTLVSSIALMTLYASHAFAAPSLSISDAYARATPPNVTTSAVFAKLHNSTDKEVVVVSAKTERAGAVELHTVEQQGDVMKMRQVESFTIASEATFELKPGAEHIMLFNLDAPLKMGEQLSVELTLSTGEQINFDAPVKKVMQGMKHHHH